MSLNDAISNVDFHVNETGTGNGKEYNIIGQELLVNVEIESNGTFVAVFEGKGLLGTWKEIIGINTKTLAYSTTVSDKTSFYQCDLSGLVAFRVRLATNTGSTSIYGKVVG